MARKIKVGDWVYDKRRPRIVRQVHSTSHAMVCDGLQDGHINAEDAVVLPASPAVLAKSHRLLMRFWKTRHSGASQFDVERFIYAHCRRIPKGKK